MRPLCAAYCHQDLNSNPELSVSLLRNSMKYYKKNGTTAGTIVFIHGNSSSAKVFKPQLNSEVITQTKITLDLPGHGLSPDSDKTNDYSIKHYISELIKFIQPIDDVFLIGHSLGGNLAMEVISSLNNVKGLMIFSPPLKSPINVDEVFYPSKELQTFFTENPTETDVVSAINFLLHKKDLIQLLIDDFHNTVPSVRAKIAESITNNEWKNQEEVFISTNIPKYIIYGNNDPAIRLDYLKNIQADCSNNCELHLINECGHYPSIEQPEKLIDIIAQCTKKVFC